MVLILSIAVVFDISEKLDDFQNGASMHEIIFDYYINFIAFYGNLFMDEENQAPIMGATKKSIKVSIRVKIM